VRLLVETHAGLPSEPLFHERTAWESAVFPRQDSITVQLTPARRQSWYLRAAWDGSAAALLSVLSHEEHERRVVADGLFSEALRPMAEAVGSLMVALGGHGRAHVALRVAARGFWLEHPIEHSLARRSIPEKDDRHPIPLLPIQSWTDAELGVDDELLQSMKRELLRACGFPEWSRAPRLDWAQEPI
jgi:hypothetical protein